MLNKFPKFMFLNKLRFALVLLLLVINVSAQQKQESSSYYTLSGRVAPLENNQVLLIGSAASVAFEFTGSTCAISLQSVDGFEHHNYVSLVVDGEYLGRLRIEKGSAQSFPIQVTSAKETHRLEVYKATEAANGSVLFAGTTAQVIPSKTKIKNKKKIEFIGDSITCGMGNDSNPIPCGSGEWYDQHNGYLAYGPVLSRRLDADYLLSSVSGIGMYRNWNDEHLEEAIMPDVYENLHT